MTLRKLELTRDTAVSLSLVGLLLVPALAGLWQLSEMRHQLETLVADHWGLANESERSLRMALENPGLRVPDPRNLNRVIVSRGAHFETSGVDTRNGISELQSSGNGDGY